MRWLLAIGELALLCWFVAIGCEAILQRAMLMRSPFQMGEFHHAFVGLLLVILGWWLASVAGIVVQLLGIIVTADDVYQHEVQTLNGRSDYRSPLHVLFAVTLWRLPFMPGLVRVLDRWWGASVVLGLLLFWIFGCAPASLVPMVWRPDTRALSGVLFDTVAIRQTVELMQAAYPRETAVCLYGELRDSTLGADVRHLIYVAVNRAARRDSADDRHVWFPIDDIAGCDNIGLVGIAHSHPLAVGIRECTHSDPDSNVLFEKPRALFTMIFCGDGRAEIFFQDGRREPDIWAIARRPP